MPLLTLVAVASFACQNPAHPEGDQIRCAGRGAAMQLYGIDAPPVRGPCRSYGSCPVDEGAVARDHLAELTRGRRVTCTSAGADARGRRSVRCEVSGKDLSCTMVTDAEALKTVPMKGCVPDPVARARKSGALTVQPLDIPPTLWKLVPVYLLAINIATYLAFMADRRRSRRAMNRIADIHLLVLVALGGGIGGLASLLTMEHLQEEVSFGNQLAVLIGLQIGAIVGAVGLALWPGPVVL